jgi:hypothetical protein
MDLHPDFKELLGECEAAKVEFAIVGGYAVGFHARPRATTDLDLLVLGMPENLARLAEALAVFGAPPNVVAAAMTAEADDVIYFGVAPLRVDIMTRADGIDTRAALERAVYADLGTVSVPILGLADLIANKRASGRKQALADLEALELVHSGP